MGSGSELFCGLLEAGRMPDVEIHFITLLLISRFPVLLLADGSK